MYNINNGELHKSIVNLLIERGEAESWNDYLLASVCEDLGIKGAEKLLYPNGINDVIDLLFQEVDQEMIQKGKQDILDWAAIHQSTNERDIDDITNTKIPIHKQVALYLYARFGILQQYKEVLPNIVRHLAYPSNIAFAAKMVWRMADCVWNIVGDTSTDYNYYTKRSLLSAVYCTSVGYYLQDKSPNHNNTRLFIDKRLKNVLSIHKFKAKIMNLYKSSRI